MRVSTEQIYQRGVDSILDQQSQMNKTQMQLGNGKRVTLPSDDPTAAVHVLDLQHSIQITKTYQDNLNMARASLDREEQAVGSSLDILQRVRELALQSDTGLLDSQARQGIVKEVQEHLAALLDLANTRDGTGDYLFAGYSTNTQPFTQTAGGFSYSGDQGQRFLQIGPNRQIAISDSGADVFQAIINGNGTFVATPTVTNTGTGVIDPGAVTNPAAWVRDTYTITFLTDTTYEVRDSATALVTSGAYQSDTAIAFNGIQTGISGTPLAGDTFTVAPSSNQDVFTTLQNLVTALGTNVTDAASQAKLSNDVNRSLVDLDRVIENFSTVQSVVGSRLKALDSQETINNDFVSNSEIALSAVQDLDYAEAVSRFNRQLLALQAAQQTFMKVQNLSLFNFM